MDERRGPGRPPLSPERRHVQRVVILPPELDAAADELRGGTGWSEWLRGLVMEAVVRGMPLERRPRHWLCGACGNEDRTWAASCPTCGEHFRGRFASLKSEGER